MLPNFEIAQLLKCIFTFITLNLQLYRWELTDQSQRMTHKSDLSVSKTEVSRVVNHDSKREKNEIVNFNPRKCKIFEFRKKCLRDNKFLFISKEKLQNILRRMALIKNLENLLWKFMTTYRKSMDGYLKNQYQGNSFSWLVLPLENIRLKFPIFGHITKLFVKI